MKNKITGLISAAGLSYRMGNFKPLLNYNGKSFLKNVVDKLIPICDNLIIITGHNANLIDNEVQSFQNKDKIKTIFNKNFKNGMLTSLQIGLSYSLNSDWILYHFIDQPNLPEAFYKEFITQIDYSFDWIQPTSNQNNGHPILLNNKLISIISSLPTTCNLKEASNKKNIKKKYWNCKYSEILNDIDTIENYNELIW